MIRLRPEQVIGSLLQAMNIKTGDQNSHLIQRFVRFVWGKDFVKLYGDLGNLELEGRGGTIPQRLLLLNGKFVHEATEAQPFSAAGRVAAFAPNDLACVETSYLVCLSRLPTDRERAVFVDQLARSADKNQRLKHVQDLFWSLVNCTEFTWVH